MTGADLWENYRITCRVTVSFSIPPWHQVPYPIKAWWNAQARKISEGVPTKRSKIQALIDGATTPGEKLAAQAAMERIKCRT